MKHPPIFILASGQRCGSTLLQRLLNSHPDIMIWGEQNGHLSGLFREYIKIVSWSHSYRHHLNGYEKGGDGFFPNLVPDEATIRRSTRQYIINLFGEAACKYNKSRWGFKEVRYGLDIAMFLRGLFPECRIIHLTRHPIDCFISLLAWERAPGSWSRAWTLEMLANWVRINSDLRQFCSGANNTLSIRYEDLVAFPRQVTNDMCRLIGVDMDGIDISIFDRKLFTEVGGGGCERNLITKNEISIEDRVLFDNLDMKFLCSELGYDLSFDAW